jgi:hypothetical protein
MIVGECVCIRFGRTRKSVLIFCSRSICFVAKRQIRQSSVNLRIKMATHHQTSDRPVELRTRNPHIDSLPFFLRFTEDACKTPEEQSAPKKRVADTATRATRVEAPTCCASRLGRWENRGGGSGADRHKQHLTALRLASPETRPRERPLSTGDARALGRRRARLPRARLVRLRRPNRRTDVFRGRDGSRSVLRPSALRGRGLRHAPGTPAAPLRRASPSPRRPRAGRPGGLEKTEVPPALRSVRPRSARPRCGFRARPLAAPAPLRRPARRRLQ